MGEICFIAFAAFTNYQKEIKIFSLSETSFITCEIFEFSCPYQKLHGEIGRAGILQL